MEITKSPESPQSIKQQIDTIVKQYGFEECADHLPPEISIVDNSALKEDCEKYALGTSGWRRLLPGMFPDIDTPQAGDIVLYHNEKSGVQHIGIYQEDGTVISRWGEGPVLKHPVDYVPSSYGEATFRRISEQKLENLRKGDPLDMIS